MKPEDKAAWLQACNEFYANSGGKDLGEYMFKAAIEHRDKQAVAQGEPVAWKHIMDNTEGIEGNEPWVVLSNSSRNPFGVAGKDYSAEYPVYSIPLYAKAPAVAVNEQMLAALEDCEKIMTERYIQDGPVAIRVGLARAAIAAAKAARGE